MLKVVVTGYQGSVHGRRIAFGVDRALGKSWTSLSAASRFRNSVPGVMTVGDPADRVAQDLHRRLRHMLVVVCRAGLAEVL